MVSLGLGQIPLLQTLPEPYEPIALFFSAGIAVHNLHPETMRPLEPVLPGGGELGRDGQNVANVLHHLETHQPKAMDRINRFLQAIVREVEQVQSIRYGDYVTTRFRMQPDAQGVRREFDTSRMSDGTLRVLGILVALFKSSLSGPTVVAIEESELSLHPAAMRALVDAVSVATAKRQVILSTHSPELLDCSPIGPENIRIVEMIDGQTVITSIDDASKEIIDRGLNTLGGLIRQNWLDLNYDDQDRQQRLAQSPQEPAV
jgi:predicted ATPase